MFELDISNELQVHRDNPFSSKGRNIDEKNVDFSVPIIISVLSISLSDRKPVNDPN